MKKRQITINDVAAALNISKSTVSRALADHLDVRAETKQRVLDYVQQSGYRPNLQALGLLRNQTNTIGVIIPNIERPFFASVISGIQHRAFQQRFRVMICQSDETLLTEIMNTEALADIRVDGLLISHSKEIVGFKHIETFQARGIPVVLFDRINNLPGISSVTTDNFLGGFLVGEHLAQQGYRRIAILAGSPSLAISEQRKQGCLTALKQHGISVAPKFIYYCNFQFEQEVRAVLNILEQDKKIEAIFSVYDMGAIIVMDVLRKQMVRVPDDIAVLGFGNEPIGQYTTPSLTTVSQNPVHMGEMAAELLFREILASNPVPMQTHVIKPELLVRESSIRASRK